MRDFIQTMSSYVVICQGEFVTGYVFFKLYKPAYKYQYI